MVTKNKIKLLNYQDHPAKSSFGVQCSVSKVVKNYPAHKHDFIELEFLANDLIHEIINGEKYTFTKGAFTFLDTNDFHSINSETDFTHFYNISLFVPELPFEIRNIILSTKLPFAGQICEEDFPLIINLFEKLLKEIKSKNENKKIKIISLTNLLILLATENKNKNIKSITNNSVDYIRSAINYIDANIENPIKLKEVADYINISECYLSELFSKYMGCRFIDFINRTRIEKAKDYLYDNKISITEISLLSGFGSFANFSRKFKKYCGCTPSEFRRKTLNLI